MQIDHGLNYKPPPLPPNFWTFGTFGILFFGHNSKMVGAQKVSQNFWIASETPPPLVEEIYNWAAFFLWQAPLPHSRQMLGF